MKVNLLSLGLLTISMILTSCGKKPSLAVQEAPAFKPSRSKLMLDAMRTLRIAVETDDVSSLESALEHDLDLNSVAILENGDTPLTYAIRMKHASIWSYILKRDLADVNVPNVNGETPLILAAQFNQQDVVAGLLSSGAQIDRKNSQNNTALHMAILQGHTELATGLIKKGASLTELGQGDKTALMLAQELGHDELAEFIRSMVACSELPTIERFQSILEGSDVSAFNDIISRYPQLIRSYESLNPLALTLDNPDYNAGYRMAELLLSYHQNPNGPDSAEVTPLIKAVTLKNLGFARLFLHAGADPNLYDKNGKSPLIHAVEANHLRLVIELLNRYAAPKYTAEVGEQRWSVNACGYAKNVRDKLEDERALLENRRIMDRLNCRRLGWLL